MKKFPLAVGVFLLLLFIPLSSAEVLWEKTISIPNPNYPFGSYHIRLKINADFTTLDPNKFHFYTLDGKELQALLEYNFPLSASYVLKIPNSSISQIKIKYETNNLDFNLIEWMTLIATNLEVNLNSLISEFIGFSNNKWFALAGGYVDLQDKTLGLEVTQPFYLIVTRDPSNYIGVAGNTCGNSSTEVNICYTIITVQNGQQYEKNTFILRVPKHLNADFDLPSKKLYYNLTLKLREFCERDVALPIIISWYKSGVGIFVYYVLGLEENAIKLTNPPSDATLYPPAYYFPAFNGKFTYYYVGFSPSNEYVYDAYNKTKEPLDWGGTSLPTFYIMDCISGKARSFWGSIYETQYDTLKAPVEVFDFSINKFYKKDEYIGAKIGKYLVNVSWGKYGATGVYLTIHDIEQNNQVVYKKLIWRHSGSTTYYLPASVNPLLNRSYVYIFSKSNATVEQPVFVQLANIKASETYTPEPDLNYTKPRYTSDLFEINIAPSINLTKIYLYKDGALFKAWTIPAFQEFNYSDYLDVGEYKLEVYASGSKIIEDYWAVGYPPMATYIEYAHPKDGETIRQEANTIRVDVNIAFRNTVPTQVALYEVYPDGSTKLVRDLGCFQHAGHHTLLYTLDLPPNKTWKISFLSDYDGCTFYGQETAKISFATMYGKPLVSQWAKTEGTTEKGLSALEWIIQMLYKIFEIGALWWMIVAFYGATLIAERKEDRYLAFVVLYMLGVGIGVVDLWLGLIVILGLFAYGLYTGITPGFFLQRSQSIAETGIREWKHNLREGINRWMPKR